ncbi:preprotein translocase subunit SecG [Caedibacter taeniospiralis]|jgi:preprotein translocase subunit SecG|uniref:preprotein translocase subunit SecG n=1 Tax=Caedibacter taeniospiralis TaxID=28907 RepID=UPI0037C04D5D
MLALVITVHIVVAILIVGLVLLQQGKGATMGASFGSGASQTVFGSRGAAPFMFKFTAFLVAVFFVTSISLSYIGKQNANKGAGTQASSGVSQADYQKQQAAQQALIDQAKATDKKAESSTSTLPMSQLLQAPAAKEPAGKESATADKAKKPAVDKGEVAPASTK